MTICRFRRRISEKLFCFRKSLFILSVIIFSITFWSCGEKTSPLNLIIVWDQNPSLRYAPDFEIASASPDMFTRLYALRKYYPVAAILKKYPSVKFTFNLSADVAGDLEKYSRGESDKLIILSRKPPEFMKRAEKEELLRLSKYTAKFVNISRFPGFERLYKKWLSGTDLSSVANNIRNQDLRDIQTWTNLAWMGDEFFSGVRYLNQAGVKKLYDLVTKGKNYTEVQKNFVLDFQLQVVKTLPRLYRMLTDTGQVEITFSQAGNVNIPLLFNMDRISDKAGLNYSSNPGIEDGLNIIKESRLKVSREIGVPVYGFFPSFSAFSPALLDACEASGARFMFLDESILAATLERHPSLSLSARGKKNLYKAYRMNLNKRSNLNILFYDRDLSLSIQSQYPGWDEKEAALDIFKKIKSIREKYVGSDSRVVVTLLWDCDDDWRFYPHEGHVFLESLLELLSTTDEIRTVCPGDFLKRNRERSELRNIKPATSQSDGFQRWIGENEENLAWNSLMATRQAVERFYSSSQDESIYQQALNLVYLSENELWFRWFGNDCDSGIDQLLDARFRGLLKNAYKVCGIRIPGYLWNPIVKGSGGAVEPLKREKWLFYKKFGKDITESKILFSGKIDKEFDPYNRIISVEAIYDKSGVFLNVRLADNPDYERLGFEYGGVSLDPEVLKSGNRIEVFFPYEIFKSPFPEMKINLLRGNYILESCTVSLKLTPESSGEALVTFTDAEGDDYGNGGVVYPVGWNRNNTSLDLKDLSIYETDSSYVFTISLYNAVSNDGNDPFAVDMYLDFKSGGSRELLPGRQAVLDHNEWDACILYTNSGFYWIVPNSRGMPVIESDLKFERYPSKNILAVSVPRSAISRDVDLWSVLVTIEGRDYRDKNITSVLEVNTLPDDNHFGGGDDSRWDSNIIDLIGGDQGMGLGSWDQGSFCRLQMTPVIVYRQNR